MTYSDVLRRWQIASRNTELLAHRLRMYVPWSRNPKWHTQALTAIFSKLRIDRHSDEDKLGDN